MKRINVMSKSRSLRSQIRLFSTDETGTMTAFGLFLFFSMLLICGMAVDLMHFEAKRTLVQATIDRAVLAAADLDQELDAEVVVDDYFAKAGMSHCLETVTVDEGLNFKRVSATTECDVPTFFMRLMGIETLTAPGAGTAKESVNDIEISLVLDISGSMKDNKRLTNLKSAGSDFLDTMLVDSEVGLTTISLVPYNATVNLGNDLGAEYNLSNEHSYSSCASFETAHYTSTALSPTTPLNRVSHFDTLTNWRSTVTPITNINAGTRYDPHPWCWWGDNKKVIVHSSDFNELNDAIQDLEAYGNTAIDVGMRWGVALLDPSAQSPVQNLIDSNVVDGSSIGRPVDYNTADTLKVVVVMTDGRNTAQYDLKPQFKQGHSDIFVVRTINDDDGLVVSEHWSLQIDGRDTLSTADDVYYHYNPHKEDDYCSWGYGCYRNKQYLHNVPDIPRDPAVAGKTTIVESQLTWPEVFATWPRQRINREFYLEPYQRGWIDNKQLNKTLNSHVKIVNNYTANRRLSNICLQAREKGITIFTIAFEAPSAGKVALQDCASSISHYYEATGAGLGDVFSSIASQINHLRLTQ